MGVLRSFVWTYTQQFIMNSTVFFALILIAAVSAKNLPVKRMYECSDKSSNCKYLTQYCNLPQYKAMMMIKCKMSCGYCSGGFGDCKDESANCGYLKDNCSNTYFAVK